jgi:hypothetical protein
MPGFSRHRVEQSADSGAIDKIDERLPIGWTSLMVAAEPS